MLSKNLSLLLSSSALLFASHAAAQEQNHTVCYPFWAALQTGNDAQPLMMQTTVRMISDVDEGYPIVPPGPPPIPEFRNPNGSIEVSGDRESICGKPYHGRSVSACLWNGAIDEDPAATKPGWLESSDQRNCFKRLLVSKIRPTKTPGDYVVVPIVDGCTMHIPASKPEVGCKELWLTKGAFKAIGATKAEMRSEQIALQWTFLDIPA